MGYMVHFILGLLLISSSCWILESAQLHQQVQLPNSDKPVPEQNAHINENEKKTEDEGKSHRNVNNLNDLDEEVNNKKSKTVVSTEKTNNLDKQNNVVANSNVKLNDSSVIKLQHAEPYNKENVTRGNADSREDVGRSIDIGKYVSEEFHNKNNVYVLPVSPDTEKYINPEYDYVSISHPHNHDQTKSFSYTSELTTPTSSIFDNRYQETVKNVDQTLEHIDNTSDLSEESLDFSNIDALHEATKQNDTQANLEYVNFQNVIKNDTENKNALHKDLTVESGTNLNFESSYNKTKKIDEVPENENKTVTNNRQNSQTNTEDNSKEETSGRPFLLTTRKNILLTKPPSNKNSSHISILSNKIEAETVKYIESPTPTTATKEEVIRSRTTPISKRGTIKFSDYAKTHFDGSTTPTINKNKTTEQLVQENQIIPISIEAPLNIYQSDETTTTEASTTTVETTTFLGVTLGESTTLLADSTTNIITTTESVSTTTEGSISTTTQAITDSTATVTPTLTSIPDATTLIPQTTESLKYTESPIFSSTIEADIVTSTTIASTTAAAKTEAEAVTITSTISPTTSETTTNLPETTSNSLSSNEDKTTTIFPFTDKVISDFTTTPTTTFFTTESPNGAAFSSKKIIEENSTDIYTTVGGFELRKVPTEPTTTTTEILFVHIEDNHTTILPDTVDPEYPTPFPIGVNTNSTSKNDGSNDGSGDNTGTIAAIAISSIGAVCLILLAGLLFIMKKRQKRFNYGQRCTPVSLDDYSMDNVSVYNSVRRKGALRSSKRSYGNPAFEDPVCVSHPLNFPALGKFANNTEELKAEFEEIPQIHARTNELPEGCDSKNRYANVIPLPETRVFLTPIDGYPNSDYINANYVAGPKNTKGYYIACQAPLQSTIDDFWRMIWEQNCRVILMLTHLFENGVEKCVDYLPPSEVLDCHRLFGDFQITLKKREVKDKYIISTVQLKNMVSNSWREVTHFWYLGWPDKGVPSEANSLIAFLIEARSYMKSSLDKNKEQNGNLTNGRANNELNPVVVHCSPGTGRTGTVIACDISIREFEQDRVIDIPRIVYKIRRDRASAVQTKEQYAFIYKVVNLYATKLAGGALDSI